MNNILLPYERKEMSDKAQVIEKRYSKQCAVCMLIDADDRDMTWHLYQEGLVEDEDKYVCNDCLKGIKDIRKKCHQKFDNPNHGVFDNFIPWFAQQVPGMKDAFTEK
jgi:hypothetical protein